MIRGGFADQIFIYVAVVVAAHAHCCLKRLQRGARKRHEYQQALAATEPQVVKMQCLLPWGRNQRFFRTETGTSKH